MGNLAEQLVEQQGLGLVVPSTFTSEYDPSIPVVQATLVDDLKPASLDEVHALIQAVETVVETVVTSTTTTTISSTISPVAPEPPIAVPIAEDGRPMKA